MVTWKLWEVCFSKKGGAHMGAVTSLPHLIRIRVYLIFEILTKPNGTIMHKWKPPPGKKVPLHLHPFLPLSLHVNFSLFLILLFLSQLHYPCSWFLSLHPLLLLKYPNFPHPLPLFLSLLLLLKTVIFCI